MKRLFCIAALVSIYASIAGATGGVIPSLVYQTGVSSITTNIISVSTSPTTGATQMDNPTLQNRVAVEIQNIDPSANLWCLPTSSASLTSNTNTGRKISAGASWVLSFTDRVYVPNDPTRVFSATNTNLWCISDGTSTTKAVVTQLY